MGSIYPWEEAILGKGAPIVSNGDTLRSSVRKRLNRSWCRLDYGLRMAKEYWIKSGPDPPWKGAILGEGVAHCKVEALSAVSCAEVAEPIELQVGLWTRVGRSKNKFNHIRQVTPMCPHGRTHWRHLANTFEPSVFCGDAVLCQVTLTICFALNANRFSEDRDIRCQIFSIRAQCD